MPGLFEVCVVSYNSASVLERSLKAISANMPDTSIAIREHGSDRRAIAELERLASASTRSIRIEFDSSNPGFGAGCNALASSSDAEWVVFLNPDAEIVAWPWAAHEHPQANTIVGPSMGSVKETMRHCGRSFTVGDEIRRSWFRRRGQMPDGHGFVSGAALMIERAPFLELGGFDEEYFLFYEDIDFCLRANAAGIATTVQQEWVVRHEGGHSTRTQFGDSLVWSFRSALRFHGTRGASLKLYRAYVAVDALLRWTMHTARRNQNERRAYQRLVRIALQGEPLSNTGCGRIQGVIR